MALGEIPNPEDAAWWDNWEKELRALTGSWFDENLQTAERSMLGCALRYRDSLMEMLQEVDADAFYHYAHQKIWVALAAMAVSGKDIGPETLADKLLEMGVIKDVGYEYIAQTWDDACVMWRDRWHVVKGHSIRRAHVKAIEHLARNVVSGMPAEELNREAELAMANLGTIFQKHSKLIHMGELESEVLELLDLRASKNKGEYELPFGWIDLNKLTGGLSRGELTVVGARPSIGKTIFGSNMAEHLARNGKRIFFSTLEMKATALFERMLCRATRIPSERFRSGRVEARPVLEAAEILGRLDIVYDDYRPQTVSRISAKARLMHMRQKLDCVVVDYLNLIEVEDRRDPRYLQIGLICQRLKQLAGELDVPVVLTAQLTRDADGRRPGLADLRESGDIEQHADSVFLMHRPEEVDVTKDTQIVEVLVSKQRNGPIGSIELLHHKKFFEFANYFPGGPLT